MAYKYHSGKILTQILFNLKIFNLKRTKATTNKRAKKEKKYRKRINSFPNHKGKLKVSI